MELRHLRYFAAVAEHLNYSEASRRLHVAQAAISQTIFDLEEELEARLLSRTKRKVQLTAAGAIFLKEAEEILRRAGQATQLVRRAARGEVGTLTIGFLGPATSEFLPALIQDYRSRFPGVELRLQHMNPDEQLAAFDEGRIDVGLSRSLPPERRTSFNETTIYTDYLMVALPGTHPLAKERAIKLKNLADEPFVLFHRLGNPSAFDEIVAICRRAGFSPRIVLEPSLLATVITLVESGLGVSLVPGCARSLWQKTVAFRPLASRSKPLVLCVAWPRPIDSPIVEGFLETLRSQECVIKKQMQNPVFC
jgi:DNA-binding transcriptional LysR family regulator